MYLSFDFESRERPWYPKRLPFKSLRGIIILSSSNSTLSKTFKCLLVHFLKFGQKYNLFNLSLGTLRFNRYCFAGCVIFRD